MDWLVPPDLQPAAWFAAAASAAFVALVAAWILRARGRRARRRRIFAAPLSAVQARVLDEHVPLYGRLPPDLRAELAGRVQVFLAEKRFEGCGGLTVTDPMRRVIAAHACLLQLGRPRPDYYPTLLSILVYPRTYRVRVQTAGHLESFEARAGESWRRGEVVIAWDEALDGSRQPADGHNLILHEFAHQVDHAEGLTDPLALTSTRGPAGQWARVVNARYEELVAAVEADLPAPLDAYGATNPAEFFAVATEMFFERPADLREAMPDLYAELVRVYGLDPERSRLG
jgi:MtfA peptidase